MRSPKSRNIISLFTCLCISKALLISNIFATYLFEDINLFVILCCFSCETVYAGKRKSRGLCQILAKVSNNLCFFSSSFAYFATCYLWLLLWLLLYFIPTVGSNTNGPVTGVTSGTPHDEPLPSHGPQQKGRVQRSKSFPWEGPSSFELPQPTMPSFEEKDKESPIEVLIISSFAITLLFGVGLGLLS